MKNRWVWTGTCALLLPLAGACATTRPPSLYQRLGGEPGVRVVVDDFVDRFRRTEDERIQNPAVTRRHAAADLKSLKELWVQFITKNAGGPDHYKGRDMKWAHAGLNITPAQFDATLGIMRDSLAASKIGPREQQELLALMRAQQGDIVEVH